MQDAFGCADHQPDIFKQTYKFVHAKDRIVARLTGGIRHDSVRRIEHELYDLEAGVWSQRIIEVAISIRLNCRDCVNRWT